MVSSSVEAMFHTSAGRVVQYGGGEQKQDIFAPNDTLQVNAYYINEPMPDFAEHFAYEYCVST